MTDPSIYPQPGQPQYSKICLVMMCYNEENFIVKALESVVKYISYWIILDSHSTDATEHEARTFMGGTGIPGMFLQYDQPFRADAKRTAAMHLAKVAAGDKCDYMLMIDADNTIEIVPVNEGEPDLEPVYIDLFIGLTADAYYITKRSGAVDYPVLQLFSMQREWRFVGIIHESPTTADGTPFTMQQLPGLVVHEPVKTEGPRARTPRHYYDHALTLEREMFDNPELTGDLLNRYIFYAANSWRDAGFIDRAIDCYTSRILKGGWIEEIWYSYYMIAQLDTKNDPIKLALRCWDFRPQRLEGAYLLMSRLINAGMPAAAWYIGQVSADFPPCKDLLMIERDIYRHKFPEMMRSLEKDLQE